MNPSSVYAEYAVYSPNEFSKGFCAGGSCRWRAKRYITDARCPCRGAQDGPSKCHKFANFIDPESKMPTSDEVCWRYSFRWHLEQAHKHNGCMLQVREDNTLGAGQRIELEMAEAVQIP